MHGLSIQAPCPVRKFASAQCTSAPTCTRQISASKLSQRVLRGFFATIQCPKWFSPNFHFISLLHDPPESPLPALLFVFWCLLVLVLVFFVLSMPQPETHSQVQWRKLTCAFSAHMAPLVQKETNQTPTTTTKNPQQNNEREREEI